MMFPTLIAASDAPASYFWSSAAQNPISTTEVTPEMNAVVTPRTLNRVIYEPSVRDDIVRWSAPPRQLPSPILRLASSTKTEYQPSSVELCAKTSAGSSLSPTQKCWQSSEDHLYRPRRWSQRIVRYRQISRDRPRRSSRRPWLGRWAGMLLP